MKTNNKNEILSDITDKNRIQQEISDISWIYGKHGEAAYANGFGAGADIP